MTTPPITPATIQALAAYGAPVRAPAPAAEQASFIPAMAPVPAARLGPDVAVTLSPAAREALIAVQSAASAATPAGPAPAAHASSIYQPAVPGSTLNLKI